MQAFEAQSTRDLPRSQTLLPICHETELGICPTGEHLGDCRRCGFAGCVDLRPWAKANRYRFRLEESYGAESNTHVRGDGRWYVEILCKRGTIYPYGGHEVCAFTKSGYAWQALLKLGSEIRSHQVGDQERVCRFPVELLDRVAAILQPRRRRTLSPERARAISGVIKAHAQSGQIAQGLTNEWRLILSYLTLNRPLKL